MAFFNDFKEMFANAAQSVTSKAKESLDMTKLTTERRNLSGEMNELFEQLGRSYFESAGEDHEKLDTLTTRLKELHERCEELDRQKMLLRNQNRCPACGAVMQQNAKFCSSCGQRMPETTPEPEPAPEMKNVNYCPECGAMRGSEDRFCDVCGHSYADDVETEPEADSAAEAQAPAEPEAPAEPDEAAADEAPDDFNAE